MSFELGDKNSTADLLADVIDSALKSKDVNNLDVQLSNLFQHIQTKKSSFSGFIVDYLDFH
jgi:hypothetical protein